MAEMSCSAPKLTTALLSCVAPHRAFSLPPPSHFSQETATASSYSSRSPSAEVGEARGWIIYATADAVVGEAVQQKMIGVAPALAAAVDGVAAVAFSSFLLPSAWGGDNIPR